jgi:hypothetical protein
MLRNRRIVCLCGVISRLLMGAADLEAQPLGPEEAPGSVDIVQLECVQEGVAKMATLSWTNGGALDEIRVYRDGDLVDVIPGSQQSIEVELDGRSVIHRFRVAALVGGAEQSGESCVILIDGAALATVIDEDFNPIPSPTKLRLHCDAAVRGGSLELTRAREQVAGSAFFLEAHSSEVFRAEFDFRFPDASDPGADGLAFIINTGDPNGTCGNRGSAMGFRTEDDGPSVYPGYAITFDTFPSQSNFRHNSVTLVDLDEPGPPVWIELVPEEFCDNGTFHATVVGDHGTFAVFLENSSIGMPRREVFVHTIDGVVPGEAYFGFSAATGSFFARHIVDDFQLRVPVTDPPNAAFRASPRVGEVPLSVSFSNESQGWVDSVLWDFGDGQTSTIPSPTHVYENVGSYDVRLTIVGPGGSAELIRFEYIAVSEPQGEFIRGDSDGNGEIDITDGIFVLLYAFTGRTSTNCEDALDADDSGRIDATDALRVLRYVFSSGPAPEEPYPVPDADPTLDELRRCERGL